MSRIPSRKVYLPIPITIAYGREVLRGVRDYLTAHRSWEMVIVDASPNRKQWVKDQMPEDASAVLGFIASPTVQEIVAPLQVPKINISALQPCPGVPSVLPDNQAAGRMAAEHLLERGFVNFAYLGYGQHWYSTERAKGVRQALHATGRGLTLIESPHWNQTTAWFQSLPKPVGIITANDGLAVRVLSTLALAGIPVPDQAALVGVDNDDLVCELADPPLSSVDPGAREVGYVAAALTDQLIQGGGPVPEMTLVQPTGMVGRASSNVFAVEDPELAVALRLIHQHACDPIRIYQIVEHLDVSRSTLEKRFRDVIGHTAHDEIRRVQMNQARRMLARTNKTIPEIALASGFSDPKRFTTLFRLEVGIPPLRYRQKEQGRNR